MIKGFLNKILSMILLVIYCITISPYFLFHNHTQNHDHHNHSHNHDHDESLHCEYIFQNLDDTKNCSHQSHVLNLKQKCHICDYITCFDKAIHSSQLNFGIVFLNIDIIQIYYSLLLDDNTIYLNKSPPFIS